VPKYEDVSVGFRSQREYERDISYEIIALSNPPPSIERGGFRGLKRVGVFAASKLRSERRHENCMGYEEIKVKAQRQAEKIWDRSTIEASLKKLNEGGIPRRRLNGEEIVTNRKAILSRVQHQGEEYEFMTHNCAKGAALAVMEEFGLGNMAVVKALSPFPGFSLSGRICGAVSGGLVTLGLYFGSDDLLNYKANRAAMSAARKFLERFEAKLGSVQCEEIQALVFGSYLNPWANSTAFTEAKGYEKCSVVAGTGARLAAEIILESIKGSEAT